MEEKLQSYVEYYFRFDRSEDVKEKKAEVLANLIDRYEELLNDYDEDKAYVEAIKSMGDFYQDEVIEHPLLADTGLLVALVTAIFALVGVLFSNVLGIVLVMLSISLFAASSYYLVRHAKVVLNDEKDLDKMKFHLQKIFSYMKASFTFWSITLSFLGAKLIYSLVISMAFLGGMNNGFSMDDVVVLLAISFIVFVILLVIFLVLSRVLYSRLMHQYYLMTGDDDVDSMVSSGLSFIKDKSPSEHHEVRGFFYTLLSGRYFIPVYFTVFWLIALPFGLEIVTYGRNWSIEFGNFFSFILLSPAYHYTFPRVILALLSIGLYVMIGLSYFVKKISDKMIVIGSYGLIGLYILTVLLSNLYVFNWYIEGAIFGYFFLMGLFTMIVLVLRMFVLPSKRDK
ncbi:MAG: hypothetical protein ACVCEJ_02355 [Candidatus Izemoplasmataceae bacterium]